MPPSQTQGAEERAGEPLPARPERPQRPLHGEDDARRLLQPPDARQEGFGGGQPPPQVSRVKAIILQTKLPLSWIFHRQTILAKKHLKEFHFKM